MSKAKPHENQPKHQHWVPQFYLKYFATETSRNTDQPQVWIFPRHNKDGEEKLTSVRNVCGKRYLYSPLGNDGKRSWSVDQKLGDVETAIGSLWPKIANSNIDFRDKLVRSSLSLFIAIMHLRNPATQRMFATMHAQMIAVLEGVPKRADGTPDKETIQLKGRELKIDNADWAKFTEWDENDHHLFFTEMIEKWAVEIAEILVAKRWSVLCTEEDFFITSDKPVVLQHDSIAAPGIKTPGVLISFPLSPTRVLILDDKFSEPDGQYYALQPGAGPATNLGVWLNTERFLVTGRDVGMVLTEMMQFAYPQLRNGT